MSLVPAFPAGTDFWSTQRRGANSFRETETIEHLVAAREFGAAFVRMAFDKWKGEGRDFLAGNYDDYQGLVARDLAELRWILDGAAENNVPIVITPLGLPGNRWIQLNDDKRDLRLWSDKGWWDQAEAFWRDLATELRGHPAIAGYNILNEPTPELGTDLAEEAGAKTRDAWCQAKAGTSHDLDEFYRHIVSAIRDVDPKTPIILDTGFYAQPMAARCLSPIDDPNVIYSVHLYEPYRFTSHNNKGQFRYPGEVPYGEGIEPWDRGRLARQIQPFFDWAKENNLPRTRLMVGEFGCYRRNEGCEAWLSDTISILNEAGVHWAFYAFREEWDGYDYEVGTGALGAKYWAAIERGEHPEPPRMSNPLSEVIQSGLRGDAE
jgi:hypothetical protein